MPAAEAAAQGKKKTTPYWRTLKSNGELNPKYPGGIAELKRRLAMEGHRIIKKGKRFIVLDYEKVTAKIVPPANTRLAALHPKTRPN